MLKRLIHKAIADDKIPVGTLKAEDLSSSLLSHHGIPGTASILAYDTTLKLIGVGTREGRIKLFGQNEVEICFVSKTQAPCKFLTFFTGRGYVVQATARKHIEVWSLQSHQCVATLEWSHDITAFKVVEHTFFIYLGDETGRLSVLKYEGPGALKAMPYFIPPHITMSGLVRPNRGGAPSLVGVLPQPGEENTHSRLILAYDNGVLVLWDLSTESVVATRGGSDHQRTCLAEAGDHVGQLRHTASGVLGGAVDDEDEEVDMEERQICSLCWASDNGSLVAAGYTDGDVALWAFPAPGSGAKKLKGSGELYSGKPWREIHVEDQGSKMFVTLLEWCPEVEGGDGMGRLYVYGGGAIGLPQVISVVSLSSSPYSHAPIRSLPWFGPVADIVAVKCPTPSPASPSIPRPLSSYCLFVLTVPGQIHGWDDFSLANVMQSAEEHLPLPSPVGLTFRLGESPVSALSSLLLPANTQLALTLQENNQSAQLPTPKMPSNALWPVIGGTPPPPASVPAQETDPAPCLLLTGHDNGRVTVWDASCLPPVIVGSTSNLVGSAKVEAVEGSSRQGSLALPAVVLVEFCAQSQLLVLAHQHGLVSLHTFSNRSRNVWRHTLRKDNGIDIDVVDCPPGFQCVGLIQTHTSTVTHLSLSTAHARLAMGDSVGRVTLFCLRNFRLLFHGMPSKSDAFYSHDSNSKQVLFGSVVSLSLSLISKQNYAGMSPSSSPMVSPSPIRTQSPSISLSSKLGLSHSSASQSSSGIGQTILALFVLYPDSSLCLLDAMSGQMLGPHPFKAKKPSNACGMHLIESNGAPIPALSAPLHLRWAVEYRPSPRKLMDVPLAGPSFPSIDSLPAMTSGGPATEDQDLLSRTLSDPGPGQNQLPSPSDQNLQTAHSDVARMASSRHTILEEEGEGRDEEEGVEEEEEEQAEEGEYRVEVETAVAEEGAEHVQEEDAGPGSAPEEELEKVALEGVKEGAVEEVPALGPEEEETSGKGREAPIILLPLLLENLVQTEDVLPAFLVVLSQDFLRLYTASAALNGDKASLRKAKVFEGASAGNAVWSAVVEHPDSHGFAIVLLSDNGQAEIRSLPDLGPLWQGSLGDLLTWHPESSSPMPQFACARDGRLTVLPSDTELAQVSLFATDYGLRMPSLFPAKREALTLDLSAVSSNSEGSGSSPLPSPASAALFANFAFTKVMDSVRSAISFAGGKSQDQNEPAQPLDFDRVFSLSPFGDPDGEGPARGSTERHPSLTKADLARKQALALLSLEDPSEGGGPLAGVEPLVIEGRAEGAEEGSKTGDKIASLFHFGKKDKHKEEAGSEPARQRSVAEIKAAYGKNQSAGAAAAQAREKLHERGQKLEQLASQSEELNEGAADFAKIAELLLKKEQSKRSWWDKS